MTTIVQQLRTSPAVSPFGTTTSGPMVTRVAGLPSSVLDLVGPNTPRLLARHAKITSDLAALAPVLIDACYQLVPRLDGKAWLRRRVLAGKRALHALLTLPWDDAVQAEVQARVTGRQAAALDRWRELTAARGDVRALLRIQLDADRIAAIDGLHDALRDQDYLRSLAVAAPDWLQHAQPDRRRANSSRTVRTLLSYATRACVKTSPFSGLTTVGLAGLTGAGRARSRVTGLLAPIVLEQLARDDRTAGLLRYRVIPMRPGGELEPNGLVLHSDNVFVDGIVWRDDRVIEADHARRWVLALGAQEPAGLTLDTVLHRLGDGGFRRFVRLLDSGVLRAVPPWQRADDPLAVLADLVAGSDSPVSHQSLLEVDELGTSTAERDAAGRVGAAMSIRQRTSSWLDLDDLGQHKPSSMVYEDRETDLELPDPRSVPSIAADLEQLGETMRPFLFRSHLYDLLVERFVAEVGVGGSCRDPLGFLMRTSVDRDADPALERAKFADLRARSNPAERAWLPVGPTSSPPSSGVFFQIAADSQADVLAGRHRTVINQFGSGSGALVARFSGLLGEPLRGQLAEHIGRLWPDLPCRELVVWTDCNTAQAESSGLLPPLLVPGEPAAPGSVDLTDTVLTHDATTDTLSLCTGDGQPFGLAYLGITPQHLLQGYLRLLGVLADPWVNASDACDYNLAHMPLLNASRGTGVTAVPRAGNGRLITRRASWVVPVASLPRPDESGDDADFALRLDAFRRANGMPEEVFLHQLGSMSAPMAGIRKPTWVSLASPLSASFVEQWLDPGTTHLRMVEACPDRRSYPLLDRTGARRAVEHAGLLSWLRPGVLTPTGGPS